MTSTDRRRFPAIAALAVAGTALAMLLSEVDAHSPDGPHDSDHNHFYLWRTTITVGESSGQLGYVKDSFGSISTGAKFNNPPWSPPRKHHFDPDYGYTVDGVYRYEDGGTEFLALEITNAPTLVTAPGNVALWIGNTSFRLNEGDPSPNAVDFDLDDFPSGPDLDWEEDEEVRVALVYERALPSAPTNVSVTAPSGEEGTLEVSWDEADDGTFPIECYLVEFRHPSGEARDRKQSYPGSLGTGEGCGDSPPTSVKRTDLETGVEYQVLVQALSGDGYGEWSETKTAPGTHGDSSRPERRLVRAEEAK